jgi:CubicO group peptidase (beta-lactamase class C family)
MPDPKVPVAKVVKAEPPPVSPFGTYAWTGATNATLEDLLTKEVAKPANMTSLHAPSPIPFSMIALAKDGKHLYAGSSSKDAISGVVTRLDLEMDFSASLLKVGVLYAATELLAAVNRLVAQDSITSQADLVSACQKKFTPEIDKAAWARVRNKPRVSSSNPASFPDWDNIFSWTGKAEPDGPVEFSTKAVTTNRIGFRPNGTWGALVLNNTFAVSLRDMITVSGDIEAAQCIAGLGYAYLNAVMIKGGFFDPSATKGHERGIWIAGDYENMLQERIKAVNDRDGALVMCTEAMCRMMAMIESGVLVNDTAVGGKSNENMRNALATTMTHNQPFIQRLSATAPASPFTLTRNKLGYGFKGKSTTEILTSECSVLQWKLDAAGNTQKLLDKHKLTGTLIVCWQNVRWDLFDWFDPIADIVAQTLTNFLATTP